MSRRFDLAELRSAYDEQWARVGAWLRALPAEAWDRPSALPGWTVTELAVHVAHVATALRGPLQAGPVRERALSVADYVAAWPGAAAQIAERSRLGLDRAGALDLLDAEAAALTPLLDAVSGDVVVAARRGPIRLSDFLATRVDELVVHGRDLAASVPDAATPLQHAPAAVAVACRVLADVLAARAPGRSVELRVPPYVAVQVVEGPRHTRGTPGNVVEAEPMAWVELATGRLGWAGALADGRVRASGDRADLSAYLPVLA